MTGVPPGGRTERLHHGKGKKKTTSTAAKKQKQKNSRGTLWVCGGDRPPTSAVPQSTKIFQDHRWPGVSPRGKTNASGKNADKINRHTVTPEAPPAIGFHAVGTENTYDKANKTIRHRHHQRAASDRFPPWKRERVRHSLTKPSDMVETRELPVAGFRQGGKQRLHTTTGGTHTAGRELTACEPSGTGGCSAGVPPLLLIPPCDI